jgi:hypothetical protein
MMNDVVGSSDMTQGNFTYFTTDRFGCEESSLALNNGWTQVPSGFYFDTPEFTMSVWVYTLNVGNSARVIDFGNYQTPTLGSNNIILSFGVADNKPALNIFNATGTGITNPCISSQALEIGSWQFLTASFNGTQISVYINGNLTCTKSVSYSLPYIMRTNNYIGKPYDQTYSYSNSHLDDLRFYNKSLTQEEISTLMNFSHNSSG